MFAAKLEAAKRDTARRNGFQKVDFEPIEDSPQEQAYHCKADIIGYGGAAGGGKSYLMLGKAFYAT